VKRSSRLNPLTSVMCRKINSAPGCSRGQTFFGDFGDNDGSELVRTGLPGSSVFRVEFFVVHLSRFTPI
jgi:hypothetical protein